MPFWTQKDVARLVRWSTESFFLGHSLPLRGRLTSLHFAPVSVALVSSFVMYLNGMSSMWSSLAVCIGVLVSGGMFIVFPLPVLRPIGGRYCVSIAHMDGRASQQLPPVAVFYPTNMSPDIKGISYVPFDDSRFIRGVAAYAKLPYFFLKDFMLLRVGATMNAVQADILSNGRMPPIVVFSHGLAGYHRLYSCFAMDLAARGAVVVSVGHCDNSASFMRDSTGEESAVYLKDYGWQVPKREMQISKRVKEVRRVLERLGETDFWTDLGCSASDAENFLSRRPQVHLSGHSFGGATALAVALEESQNATKVVNVRSVFVYDPWMLPIQGEHFFKPLSDGSKAYCIPTVTIHSDDWVNDSESWSFFQKVKSVVLAQPSYASLGSDEREAKFRTLITRNTSHISMVDIAVLSPVIHGKVNSVVSPRVQIMEWCNALLQFARANTVVSDLS
uniref:1-alkyl-2-acetylglycerophosphocholine esterase n=1 Tax=Trypanosoma congolense (strain IL3000) TaxID=1068625 RepID=F9WED8_TRYCI|nr:unnamed protein product [Trypanosoma congolense IL3000]